MPQKSQRQPARRSSGGQGSQTVASGSGFDSGDINQLSSASPGVSWKRGLLLFILPLLAYLPVVRAGYIWDDDAYVTNNRTLHDLEGLYRIWFEPLSIPQYYPLVHTTYWIENQIWGLDPTGYHIVNVLLHIASVFLFWKLLTFLRLPGAWLAAAIFAVHPVMVESVAWITERKNVLSLCLALASMLCLLRFFSAGESEIDHGSRNAGKRGARKRDKGGHRQASREVFPRWIWYASALLLFAAALMSKTVVCTLPAVMLVIQWWKTGRISLGWVAALLPFFLLGISLGLTTVWLEKHHVGAQGSEWSLGLVERGILAGRVLWFYAGKLVWPHPLIFFYPRWEIDAHSPWQYLFAAAFLGLLVVLWAVRNRIGRGALAAVMIFSGVLFPALGFIDVYPFRYSFVADHFQYHASLALIALFSGSITCFWNRWALRDQALEKWGKWSAGLLLAILITLSFRQTLAYRDLETVFKDTLTKNPAAWGASLNLVNLYLDEGRLDEALEAAQHGVEMSPESPEMHNSLGGAIVSIGLSRGLDRIDVESAINCFTETIRLEPKYYEAYFNLASLLRILGRHEDAIPYYIRLLAMVPDDYEAAEGLCQCYLALENYEAASPILEAILAVAPNQAWVHSALGTAALRSGRPEAALGFFERAIILSPNESSPRIEMGKAMEALGRAREAAEYFSKALEIDSSMQEAAENRPRTMKD
jgi:tetratricopeptide (TPR) repeat protein